MSFRLRGGSKSRTTLSDVARLAGVSPITVSRALREPHKVSEKLRETILDVVEEIGYVPNFAARALASRHSGIVAVLAPIMEMSGFFHAARGVEDRFLTSDVSTQFANIGLNAAEEAKLLRLFVAQNPAGIILESVAEFPVNKPLIAELGCPVVQMMDTSIEPLDMGVGIRNRAAAAAAVEHLLAQGYERIALLGGGKDIRSRRRFEGYRDALLKAGCYDPAYVFEAETGNPMEQGVNLIRNLRRRMPEVDAVFCHNDRLAMGVYFGAQQLGVRVPEELGICGYNGVDFAEMEESPLTSVYVPLYEIGFKAAELIMRYLTEGERPEAAVELPFEIIEGNSTRR
ncbi:LacI family DNA-binding transcriptional regulator [Martelella lutilitoris]|uniref:LacI family DNA-binding transcriptional regulator n=1 Tax=Martelella lutilitoris TaxID=2583532 RepID=UPI001651648F|nr:LacI family DNA-binding transcriptional regulator [Martelella lutilitoris]